MATIYKYLIGEYNPDWIGTEEDYWSEFTYAKNKHEWDWEHDADMIATDIFEHEYDNCEGWNWMKPNKDYKIQITNTVTNETRMFVCVMELKPEFTVYKEN